MKSNTDAHPIGDVLKNFFEVSLSSLESEVSASNSAVQEVLSVFKCKQNELPLLNVKGIPKSVRRSFFSAIFEDSFLK
jgi:hypothetical protein